jgi:peptidoglycan biosynthesis protein MviN/MurJ (putative lipid II flippase)
MATVGLNLAMNIAFILLLPTYWKHAGMAFSTVLAEAIGMLVLGTILTRRVKNLQWVETAKSFLRCLLAGFAMAAAAWAVAHFLLPILGNHLPSKIAQIATLGLAIGTGATTYLLLALLLRAPELREIKSAIRG